MGSIGGGQGNPQQTQNPQKRGPNAEIEESNDPCGGGSQVVASKFWRSPLEEDQCPLAKGCQSSTKGGWFLSLGPWAH